ncbi:MAG: TolC family outer membrane protein [Xanthomonadales bacterium]|nr:TolC family outer membrane protein [Xanthomonadales bacterium]
MSFEVKLIGRVMAGLLVAPALYAVDLVGVHDLALKSDPQLQAAEFRRRSAGENKAIARANLLPQISGSATMTRGETETNFATVNVDSDVDTENYTVDLRQSLYRQANYEQLDVARGQISQAEAVYQVAFQDFLLRVSEAYFQVLTLTDGVTFAEAEEKAFKRQFEQAEQRFEVGLTAVTDVLEARATYDNARARAIVARNDLADAKEQLRELTGQYFEVFDPLQEVLPLVEPDPINVETWVETALRNNPSVLSSRAATDIADANMRLARAGHFPTLDLVARYNRFIDNERLLVLQEPPLFSKLQVDDSQIQVVLDIPLFEGGRVNAQTRQARYLLDATGQDLDDVQRATVSQTRNAYRAVMAGIQEVQAFEQARISAESALEATQAGFEVGTRTIVDVLIAEQRRFQAQRDSSVARHAYIIRHLRLKSVAGLLESEDLRVVNDLLE